MLKQSYKVAAGLLTIGITGPALAGNNDAVVGALVGAGLGAAIGHGIDGRNGAVIGTAIGAVAGSAIASRNDRGNYRGNYRNDYRGADRRHDRHRHHVRYIEPAYAYAPQYVYYRQAPVVVYEQPRPVHYQPRPVVYYPAPQPVTRVEYRSYQDYGARYQKHDDRREWRRDYRSRHWD